MKNRKSHLKRPQIMSSSLYCFSRHQMPASGMNFRNIGVQGRTVVMRSSPNNYDGQEYESYAEEQN